MHPGISDSLRRASPFEATAHGAPRRTCYTRDRTLYGTSIGNALFSAVCAVVHPPGRRRPEFFRPRTRTPACNKNPAAIDKHPARPGSDPVIWDHGASEQNALCCRPFRGMRFSG